VLSLKAAAPQKASFGDTYLLVQLDDPFGCFDAAAAEAAIGEPAMTRYRSAIAERWRQAKDAVLALKAEHAAKVANRKGRAPVFERTSERDLSLLTLERLHLAQLEATGQVDEAMAVLREDLSDAHAHNKVIGYLEVTAASVRRLPRPSRAARCSLTTGACRTISCGATSVMVGLQRRWRCGVSSASAARA
jgi:hypothetical protein